jgi:hypothetical protein
VLIRDIDNQPFFAILYRDGDLLMQIVVDVPHEKADFMLEMLKNFSFVENVTATKNEKTASKQNRTIGILDGIGDVIIKDNWKMTEEEFLGL